jgi:UDP-N-acetylmuramoylalanine--D-glutamate ligase
MTVAIGASFSGKTILVVGAALSGIASAEFLLLRSGRVVLTDLRPEESLAKTIAPLQKLAQASGELILELGEHRPDSFRSCDLVVVSPGVPLTLPFIQESRRAGIPVIGEIELAYKHLPGKILGITGSNGKTTTTTLLAELLQGAGLKAHAAGNIGTPLIAFASDSRPDDIYSTELSSFQLESIIEFRPSAGTILNLTPDHLDRYASFDAYIAAKQRIFMNQRETDYAVLNADDTRTADMGSALQSTIVWFSRRKEPDCGAFIRGGRIFFRKGQSELDLFPVSAVALKGNHNLENVLAACALALLAGAAPSSLEETIRNFKGVEHRLELVAEIDGVQYFNDSKATNVDAAVKSLESFPGRIHLIAGGRDKNGIFATLRPLVESRVKHLVLIGEAAGKIREALSGTTEISAAASLPEAVQKCRENAQSGDVILLAPACASFDMFQDYGHRGRVFKEAVEDLKTRNRTT